MFESISGFPEGSIRQRVARDGDHWRGGWHRGEPGESLKMDCAEHLRGAGALPAQRARIAELIERDRRGEL